MYFTDKCKLNVLSDEAVACRLETSVQFLSARLSLAGSNLTSNVTTFCRILPSSLPILFSIILNITGYSPFFRVADASRKF
jgi:hypothetical protein